MYDIDSVIPGEASQGLRPGTTLLIRGPPMVGKHELALELLTAELGDDGLLCISTKDSPSALTDSLSRHAPSLDREQIGIVCCSGSDPSNAPDDVETEFVSSPNDLTGISIGTVKVLQSFSDRNRSPVRHGVLSVSTLQQYLDTRTVFKFLHIYTRRVRDTDGLGLFTLDSSTRDPGVHTLSSEFDGVLDLRETDDGDREIRLTGLPTASRTWYPY